MNSLRSSSGIADRSLSNSSVAHEMALVRVSRELRHQPVPLARAPASRPVVHRVEIGGVETRAQDGVLLCHARRVVDWPGGQGS